MIVYAESSAVLRWLFHDEHGEQILDCLRTAEKVTCSRLTLIECRRVIRRAVHDKRITETERSDLLAMFARASARWAILEISSEVAARAEESFPSEPVRTLDALHLASMLALRENLPNLHVLTTDLRMRANARELGFECLPKI